MEINPNLGFAFLDRLMGGPGGTPERVRSLTEIEQTVMERLGQRMLDYLQEPWGSIIEMEPVSGKGGDQSPVYPAGFTQSK